MGDIKVTVEFLLNFGIFSLDKFGCVGWIQGLVWDIWHDWADQSGRVRLIWKGWVGQSDRVGLVN